MHTQSPIGRERVQKWRSDCERTATEELGCDSCDRSIAVNSPRASRICSAECADTKRTGGECGAPRPSSVPKVASSQEEIRVGPHHQARLPDWRPHVTPQDMPERCEALEELRWTPGVPDCDLMMYLRAARSMAAFAGMCDGGSAEDGCLAASRDDTTINALELLHESNYDTVKALQALVKNPIPKGIDKKWTEDEQKRFVKGLRQYGKNFFKIRKELLPHKDTADLVEFYYLWKKTPQAASTRHHRRHRRQSVLRRIRAATTSSPGNSVSKVNTASSSEFMDMSSASEEEDSDDSDSRDISSYSCQHCSTTTSKDWHHIGKDKALMCTECRLFYKKHGEMRPLPDNVNDQAPILLKVKEEESVANGKHVMRTRRSKDLNTNSKVNSACNKIAAKVSEPSSPERVDSTPSKSGRKSPTAGSCGSTSSSSNGKKSISNDSSPKGKKRTREEKPSVVADEVEEKQVVAATLIKKRKGTEESRAPSSPSESVNTDNSSGESNEEPALEHEVEETIENGSNPHSPPSPLPLVVPQSSNEVQMPPPPVEPIENVPEKTEIVEPAAPENVCAVSEPEFVAPETSTKPVAEKAALFTEVSSEPIAAAASPQMQQANAIEAESEEASDVGVSTTRVSPPPFINTCAPLLTPKQEPPSSPPPSDYSVERPLSNASEPNNVPLLHPSSSPVRVKKELTSYLPSKSPSQCHSMNRPASPVSERLPFPFMPPSPLSQPLGNITNTLLPSSQPPTMEAPRNKTPETNDSPSKPTKVSPRSRSPMISSIPLHLSSSLRLSPEMNHPQPAYTMAPTLPAEQRLPPASGHSYPSHSHHLPGPLTTTSHGFPYPHILPPQMHPYFAPPPWYTAARGIPPPPHIGFGAQSLPPSHAISSAPQSSPQGALTTPKSKSPVSSHSSKGLSHSPQTSLPHFGMHGQQSLSTPTGMFQGSQSHRHERSDHSHDRCIDKSERNDPPEEEEVEQSAFVTRGPSPEPKIEDSECHRSQSAIFLRHWNRGDFNSCSRTDLTFKPVPDSQLARKREERARKAAEKEREEQKKLAQEKGLLSHSGLEPSHHLNPFDRHTPRGNYTDTPALRQLSEYARPHGAFSPGFQRTSLGASLQGSAGPPGLPFGLAPPHGIDPLLQYQIASGMYGPVARERLEMEEREKRERMELEKRERELKEFEMKSRMASLGVVTPSPANAPTPGPGVFDPQWFELQRRYAAGIQAGGPSSATPGGPPQFSLYNPSERERLERMSMPPTSSAEALHGLAAAERLHSAFSSNDPLTRLQMANIASELHSHAHTHAHTHAHAHTHLHLHPQDPLSAAAAAAAAMGIPSHNPSLDPAIHSGHPLLPPAFPPGARPGLMSRADMLHPGLMRPPFDDHLANQMSQAMHHEQFQRQLYLADRDRLAAAAAVAGAPHTGLLPQHEEFFRQQQQQQQREREMKLRSLEEAVRGGRPC